MIGRMLAAAALALFVSSPVLADYKTCMDYCMKSNNFNYCHDVCTSSSASADSAPTVETNAVNAPTIEDGPIEICNAEMSFDERKDMIRDAFNQQVDTGGFRYREFSVVLSDEQSYDASHIWLPESNTGSGKITQEFAVHFDVFHPVYKQGATRRGTHGDDPRWFNCVMKGYISFPDYPRI